MEPAVVSGSRRTQRATVDLPQPDSPTSPNVSPGAISNETPSMAWMVGRGRPRAAVRAVARPPSGKCFSRRSMRSSGDTAMLDSEARDGMVGRDGKKTGSGAPTFVGGPGTTQGIAAAGRRGKQRGHRARDRL